MATESLKFKIELYSTYWNKPPIVEVKVGDKSYFKNEITSTEKQPTLIEFVHDCESDKSHNLSLIRTNKNVKETIVENNKIVKDQLLNIKYIEIDEINIGSLIYEGVYTPEYPQPWATQQHNKGVTLPKSFKNVTKLGHNGIWAFTFTSPFYMWLLENLY